MRHIVPWNEYERGTKSQESMAGLRDALQVASSVNVDYGID